MSVRSISFAGYRSLHELRVAPGALTVVTGGNGVGKTNLYRALELLHAAAHGRLAITLAREGGLDSVRWAGPTRHKEPGGRGARIRFGVQLDFACYELAIGLPMQGSPPPKFSLDPEVKEESLWLEPRRRPSNTWATREGHVARCLDRERTWRSYASLDATESLLAQLDEPMLLPELHQMRARLRAFRFYHAFRTDPESPLRAPQIGVTTPVLSSSGEDLAAALCTIDDIGDGPALRSAVREGLDAELDVTTYPFEVGLRVPGLSRRLRARELSDGSLKFLALLAALHSPRPAPLLVFNEPEASLHPRLCSALAASFVRASESSQVWIISHSEELRTAIEALAPIQHIELERDSAGATRIHGQGTLDQPPWP